MTLTPEREQEIRERVAKATEGPWKLSKYSEGKGGWISGLYGEWTDITITADTTRAMSNKDFIAHARQDIPDLLAALDAERASNNHWCAEARRLLNAGQEALKRAEAAKAENERLREALKPFADRAERYPSDSIVFVNDNVELWQSERNKGLSLRELGWTVGDLRAARNALGGDNG